MYFSKSKYTSFRQCPKIVWLDKYKPEEKEIDESAQERMASGNIVGDLARTLFGDFTEATTFDDDGKWELYKNGIVSFEDLQKRAPLNFLQARQVDFTLNDRGSYADNRLLDEFLSTLSYPLYFLDFETMQEVIPPFDGAKPYEQISFQYSLHYHK